MMGRPKKCKIDGFRICPRCGETKAIEEYGRHKNRSDGVRTYCKVCDKLINIDTYNNNIERRRADSLRSYHRNRADRIESQKKWRENNKDKRDRSVLNWRSKNIEKHRKIHRDVCRRYRKTVFGSINSRMAPAIRRALTQNKAGRKWEDLVGYTVSDLKGHIEKQFKDGMTWELFLRGEIHIDHKIPKSLFIYSNPDDESFKACWALENLQPLWAIDNCKKGNRTSSLEGTQLRDE